VDTETGTDIIIDSLRLKFQYDFMRADPMDTGKIKLQVLTSESDLMPYFISSQPDLNSRQDGRGEFLRTFYRKPSDKVIVEAPAEYGAWQFEKWTDLQGKNLGEDPTNPILQITLDENQTVVAQMRQIVE